MGLLSAEEITVPCRTISLPESAAGSVRPATADGTCGGGTAFFRAGAFEMITWFSRTRPVSSVPLRTADSSSSMVADLTETETRRSSSGRTSSV